MTLQTAIAVVLIANLSIAPAASPAIGVAIAGGGFQLDAAAVTGNGTLFEGSTVETGKSTSELQLQNGVRMMLDTGTRSKVYRDHLLLEKGTGQVSGGTKYRILARALQIETVGNNGLAKVSVTPESRVLVAALQGHVRVTRSGGLLVANIAAGHALQLEARDPASSQSTLSGILEKRNGRYLLTDSTAGVTVEVKGNGLEKFVGRCVEVTGGLDSGMTPAEGAAHVLISSNLDRCGDGGLIAGGGSGAAAGGTGSTGAGTAAGAAGLGIGAKVAIAGVIIGGATAGTVVGVTRTAKQAISQK